MRKHKIVKRATVQKVIKPADPELPEKAQIAVHDADDLYREIRIENTLRDDNGRKRKLKQGADVDVVVEADEGATTPGE